MQWAVILFWLRTEMPHCNPFSTNLIYMGLCTMYYIQYATLTYMQHDRFFWWGDVWYAMPPSKHLTYVGLCMVHFIQYNTTVYTQYGCIPCFLFILFCYQRKLGYIQCTAHTKVSDLTKIKNEIKYKRGRRKRWGWSASWCGARTATRTTSRWRWRPRCRRARAPAPRRYK